MQSIITLQYTTTFNCIATFIFKVSISCIATFKCKVVVLFKVDILYTVTFL
jgi:hypothetical protein